MRDRKVNLLFQVGPRREPDLPDVPLLTDLAKSAEQRQVLDALSGDIAVGRPIVAPPGVPADRVGALRKAFDATMKDPRFLADAAQQKLDIAPVMGEELQRIVSRIVGVSPAVVAMIKDAIADRDVKGLAADPKANGATGDPGD